MLFQSKEHNIFAVTSRGLYNQTSVQIRMTCEEGTKVKIGWLLKESPCMDEFYTSSNISVSKLSLSISTLDDSRSVSIFRTHSFA